jgi:hypothetical protein
MTTVAEPAILNGVYDIPADEYHASPALSSSGAKKLLHPSCPAIFEYEREHGQERKQEFDFGTAAHTLLLGSGPQPYVVDADNYQTKLARKERDDAYARGDVPLLPREFDAVQAMVAKARAHPRVAELLAQGQAEVSLLWTDPVTGVDCRARPDWLRDDGIVDYKTSTSAEPGHIAKTVANFGYHVQAAFYLAGAVELELLPPDAWFRFIFQDKNPPHLIKVVELDETALEIGRDKFEAALEVFRDCTEAGIWPDYGTDIEVISLPAYEVRRHFQGVFA